MSVIFIGKGGMLGHEVEVVELSTTSMVVECKEGPMKIVKSPKICRNNIDTISHSFVRNYYHID